MDRTKVWNRSSPGDAVRTELFDDRAKERVLGQKLVGVLPRSGIRPLMVVAGGGFQPRFKPAPCETPDGLPWSQRRAASRLGQRRRGGTESVAAIRGAWRCSP